MAKKPSNDRFVQDGGLRIVKPAPPKQKPTKK